jgi:DNA-binding MarR family transcriptional regulator
MAKKILIRDLEKPPEKNIEEDIEWICECFGFFERIDRDKTASLIFKKLLESRTNGGGLSSTRLGEETSVTRAAVLNHLKRMMCTGLIIKEGNEYQIRCSSLFLTISEMHRDVDRIFEDIEEIAKDIDENVGIKYRRR